MARPKKKIEDAHFVLDTAAIADIADLVVESAESDDFDIESAEGEFTMEDLRTLGVVDDEDFEEGNSRVDVDSDIEIHTMPQLRDPEYRAKLRSVKTASGQKSKDNGDPVADLLVGKDLDQVYAVGAEQLEVSIDALREKYGHLNPGQQRMNIGNRIRGMLKRKEKEAEATLQPVV